MIKGSGVGSCLIDSRNVQQYDLPEDCWQEKQGCFMRVADLATFGKLLPFN